MTNSRELQCLIQKNESEAQDWGAGRKNSSPATDGENRKLAHMEEDQSYAKSSLGDKVDEKPGIHGVQWNVSQINSASVLERLFTPWKFSNPLKEV